MGGISNSSVLPVAIPGNLYGGTGIPGVATPISLGRGLSYDSSTSTLTSAGGLSGPPTSVNGYVPQWDGTTGSVLAGGLPVGTSGVSTIVARDSSGNFSAGTITGTLTGTASGNLPLTGGALTGAVTSSSTLTLGGATLDSNALAVTGTGHFSGSLSVSQGVTLPSYTPGTTTNALYNAGGTLSWNGSPVGGSVLSIEAFGGGTGVADNTAAFNAIMATASSSNPRIVVLFGKGIYNFSSQLSITVPAGAPSPITSENLPGGVVLVGQGKAVTELSWTNASGGIAAGFSSSARTAAFEIHDLALSTTQYGGGTPLAVTGGTNVNATTWTTRISNVDIRGADGFQLLQYWTNGITLSQTWKVFIDNLYYSGQSQGSYSTFGVSISGTTGFAVMNVTNSTFNYCNVGAQIGSYGQGYSFIGCNFNSNPTAGIYIPSSATGTLNDQMLVVNCQFGVTANAIGIRDDAGVENIQLSNNLFVLGTNAQSVRLNPGNLFAITGNGSISPSGGTTHFNIVSNASGRGGSISGNNIYGGGNIGILLGSGTNGNVIGINNISSGGTPISDSGSGNQYVGNPGSDSKLGNINLTGAVVVEGGAVATSKSYLQINAAGIALPNGAEINWYDPSGTPLYGFSNVGDNIIVGGPGVSAFAVQTAGGNGLISNIDGQEPLGGPSHRWSSVWTISGAIQTSDETQKTDVKPSDLGLNFIRLLEPIRFKWTEGGKKIITPAVTAKAAVTDETGAIITPAVAAVPAVTESVPGKRRHYGFAAQQVHDAWVKAGAEDFGGWVKTDTTDPNSTEALRPDQITATAVQAIKELDAQVQTDRADMLALQNIVAAQAAEIAAMIAAFAK